jgi:hypothetical protein
MRHKTKFAKLRLLSDRLRRICVCEAAALIQFCGTSLTDACKLSFM